MPGLAVLVRVVICSLGLRFAGVGWRLRHFTAEATEDLVAAAAIALRGGLGRWRWWPGCRRLIRGRARVLGRGGGRSSRAWGPGAPASRIECMSGFVAPRMHFWLLSARGGKLDRLAASVVATALVVRLRRAYVRAPSKRARVMTFFVGSAAPKNCS